MIGDILIQSNFTKGGVVDTVTAYEWDPTNPAAINGTLVLLATGGECVGASPGDLVCATVNQGPVGSPWPYTPKANEGPQGTFQQGAFFEGR